MPLVDVVRERQPGRGRAAARREDLLPKETSVEDNSILQRINDLIDREHALRAAREAGAVEAAAESDELRAAEIELDQCWDLLRQRRAKRDYGADADEARVRPPSIVERYLQ